MTWKYELIAHIENDGSMGYKMIERYSDDCYGFLDENDWWFEDKYDAIATLERMIDDLKAIDE